VLKIYINCLSNQGKADGPLKCHWQFILLYVVRDFLQAQGTLRTNLNWPTDAHTHSAKSGELRCVQVCNWQMRLHF